MVSGHGLPADCPTGRLSVGAVQCIGRLLAVAHTSPDASNIGRQRVNDECHVTFGLGPWSLSLVAAAGECMVLLSTRLMGLMLLFALRALLLACTHVTSHDIRGELRSCEGRGPVLLCCLCDNRSHESCSRLMMEHRNWPKSRATINKELVDSMDDEFRQIDRLCRLCAAAISQR